MRPVLRHFVASLSLAVALSCSSRGAGQVDTGPARTSRPVVSDPGAGLPLAKFPATIGLPLACDDVCEVREVPACPSAALPGAGAMRIRGLAGKFVVAFDERGNSVEGKPSGDVQVWENLPAGSYGVIASVPLAQEGTTYHCVPVLAGRLNVYEAKDLVAWQKPPATPWMRVPSSCAAGPGRVDGHATVPEGLVDLTFATITGPGGCVRRAKLNEAGEFAVPHLATGIYVVSNWLGAVAAEVRVAEGGTAPIDLRPLEAEELRRDERRSQCGCPVPSMWHHDGPTYDPRYEPRPRFSPPPSR